MAPKPPEVALVTGGGRGIGRAIARELARAGFAVAVAARTEDQVRAVAEEIRADGGRALALLADVSSAEQVAHMVDAARAELGEINVLVANAGVVERVRVEEMTEAQWDRVLDVNLKGAFLCARAVLPSMRARKAGRIIAIGSISGTLGTPRLSAYCASKWGLTGFVKALAEEVRADGILVASVLPGSVDTEMLVGSGFAPAMQPEEVAVPVRWLATEAPLAMTGAALEIFG